MTKDELIKSVENKISYAKDYYENNKSFVPLFIVEEMKNEEKTEIVAVFKDNDSLERRFDFLFDLGVLACIKNFKGESDSVNAVYMISEVWFSSENLENAKNNYVLRPSKNPKKKEGIMVAGLSQDGINVFKMFEIKKSINLETEDYDILFEPFEEGENPAVEIESPLLKRFWDGFDLINQFWKTIPKELEDHVRDRDSEEVFKLFLKQIETLRKLKVEFIKK